MNNIISQPFLCVAAILETVLRNYGIASLSQVEIAEFFGVNVPLHYEGEVKNILKTDDINLYGIRVQKNGINTFFDHYKLPLTENYISVFTFNDWQFEDIVKDNLKNNSHIVCGFDYGRLYDTIDIGLGHVSLITAASENKITLLDPGPRGAGSKQVDIDDLFLAIKAKKDGLWIMSRK